MSEQHLRPMRIQDKLLTGLLLSFSLALIGSPSYSQMIPKLGSCPSGTTSAGGGYCKATRGGTYIPKLGSCPSGSTSAGGGYCRSRNNIQYVPKSGSCPSGTTSAGGGYCMVR